MIAQALGVWGTSAKGVPVGPTYSALPEIGRRSYDGQHTMTREMCCCYVISPMTRLNCSRGLRNDPTKVDAGHATWLDLLTM
ncbi:hypothetical protein U9M48_024984 [Paspalum notatum var. saurae]|uniref:Uncharacterized protein n=1 Tax=Paspalum notatum var. saurae TaxID=547442 RepID=A0AAQ3WWN5_PASNO